MAEKRTRRSFLATLASLPVVGGLFALKPANASPGRQDVTPLQGTRWEVDPQPTFGGKVTVGAASFHYWQELERCMCGGQQYIRANGKVWLVFLLPEHLPVRFAMHDSGGYFMARDFAGHASKQFPELAEAVDMIFSLPCREFWGPPGNAIPLGTAYVLADPKFVGKFSVETTAEVIKPTCRFVDPKFLKS